MPDRTLFIGYGRLEEWATAACRTAPVYASPLVIPAMDDSHQPTSHDLCVLVAQPDQTGTVHYWRFRAATFTTYCGTPFGSQSALRQQAQQDVWRLVREWLLEQGFTVREAVIAMPAGLRLFEGSASFFAFRQDTQRYERLDRTDRLSLAALTDERNTEGERS